jgi:hypothetical protein
MASSTSGGKGGGTAAVVRAARWVLFALLVVAAAATLQLGPAAERGGAGSAALVWVPAALLGAFIVGYAAYRAVLVRAGRYPAGRALVQVAAMLVVLAVMVGVSLDRVRSATAAGPVDLERPLGSTDPEKRALAAELARHRPREEAVHVSGRLVDLLADPSPEVRRQSRASLVALVGRDEGEGPGAADRWRAALAALPGVPAAGP